MCSILGVVSQSALSQDEIHSLNESSATALHRGPDETNYKNDLHFAFAHQRLSIIDHELGHQPFSSSDGKYTLVYNGEIYNYKELKETLILKGYQFTTNSDTEVLLLSYIEWKEEIFNYIEGMYSFIIWNHKNKSLFGARDPLGQKPFYFSEYKDKFYFSSEITPLTKHSHFKKLIDTNSMIGFLKDESFHNSQTIYRDIKQLPQGCYLTWNNGHLEITEYFQSMPGKNIHKGSVSELKELLLKHIIMTNRADVKTSLLLSGGLDSSLILALLREALPEEEITAYHINVEERSYNETLYARQAANLFNAKLIEIPLNYEKLAELATLLPTLLDTPQCDPAILPKYYICNEVSKNHKVCITGDGADELFYGYLIFKAFKLAQLYNHIPNLLQKSIRYLILNFFKEGSDYLNKGFLSRRFLNGVHGNTHNISHRFRYALNDIDLVKILHPDLKNKVSNNYINDYYKELFEKSKNINSTIDQLAFIYRNTFLSNFILPNSDRASMLNSVELRAPFLNQEIIKYSDSLSIHQKISGLKTKILLKKLALEYYPKKFVMRRKIGFTVPISHLIQTTLKEEILDVFSSSNINKTQFLDHKSVHTLLNQHFSGKMNLYKEIWSLYNLQKWMLSNKLQV